MNSPLGCPSPEALRRLGADSLGTAGFRDLEAHVASCALCRERLEEFARDDGNETTPRDSSSSSSSPRPRVPGCILGRELGRGGWGVVYEAEQPTLGRLVAVKVLTVSPDLDEKARARWLREARAAARVRHPNVVHLHDAGEHEGRFYLVFDLVPGGCLRDLARGPVAPGDAARIVETIAGAVEAIHRDGLLHLDIKPANILMDGPPGAALGALTPKLSDFGIARETSEEVGATGTLGGRGTPSYMAPEQVATRSGKIGPAADVYSLGATLYALLTGRPPFQGTTVYETMELLLLAEPASPRALAPRIPRDLETICLKALQKSPTRRYGSAQAMADDLARFREGRPILARPVSKAERVARWCRRHPVPATLTATLAMTVILALTGLTALWRRADQQRGRAEAALSRALRSDESADRLVDDLTAMLREAVEAPERFVTEQSADATDSILDLTAELRQSPERAARHAMPLAALELELASLRNERVDFEGTARLLSDAVGLLELRFRTQRDAEAGARMVEAILRRVEALTPTERFDAAAADLRLAARVLQELPDTPLVRNELVDLHVACRDLASLLDREGRPEEARNLARAHADDLAARARRFPASPVVGLIARFARAESDADADTENEMGADPPAADWTREAFALFPKGEGMPPALSQLLADLNARDLLKLADQPALGDPLAVAAAMRAAYEARCQAWGVPPEFRASTIECLSRVGCVASIVARRDDRLDEARHHIAWMVALGKMLVGRPEVLGAGHVMVSRAFEHEAKIGWAEDDLAAVDGSLRAALMEAALAAQEAPEAAVVRRHLAGIREKYARFAAAEPEPDRPVQASR